MKRLKLYLTTLLSFILASFAVFAASPDATDNLLQNILNWIVYIGALGWIADLAVSAGVSSDQALLGMLRVIIGIAVFSIIYAGAFFLQNQKNIRITISLVITLIAMIFLPSAAIVAFGTAMGSLLGFALIALVMAPLAYAYVTIPKDDLGSRIFRVVIFGAGMVSLNAAKQFAIDTLSLSVGSFPTAASGSLAETIQSLAGHIGNSLNWGITIIGLIFFFELFGLFFFSSGKAAEPLGPGAKKLLGKAKARIPFKGNRANKVRQVNLYLADEKEEEKIRDAQRSIIKWIAIIEKIISKGRFDDFNAKDGPSKLREGIKEDAEGVKEVRRYFKTLKRDLWRQNSSIQKIIDDLRDDPSAIQTIKVHENKILKLSKEVAAEIKKAEDILSALFRSSEWRALMAVKTSDIPIDLRSSTVFNDADLRTIKSELEKDEFELEGAFDKLTEANKEVQALLAATKPLYERR